MDYFHITESFQAAFPDARAGVLVMRDVINPPSHAGLDARKLELEEQIRARFRGQDSSAVMEIPEIQTYAAYYRRFRKTYHVQLQLESVAFKGKPIASGSALVEAMFMAELKNLLLTAGHDLDALDLPLTLAVSRGTETYITPNGQDQSLKARDMFIADGRGIISSILYGPDRRTLFRPQTRSALFTVYAPAGITPPEIRAHLEDIQQNVQLIAPRAVTELLEVYSAS